MLLLLGGGGCWVVAPIIKTEKEVTESLLYREGLFLVQHSGGSQKGNSHPGHIWEFSPLGWRCEELLAGRKLDSMA